MSSGSQYDGAKKGSPLRSDQQRVRGERTFSETARGGGGGWGVGGINGDADERAMLASEVCRRPCLLFEGGKQSEQESEKKREAAVNTAGDGC